MSATYTISPVPAGAIRFAGKNMRTLFTIRAMNIVSGVRAAYINLYVIFDSGRIVRRSLPRGDIFPNNGTLFDVNEILEGVIDEISDASSAEDSRFSFPADPADPVINRSQYYLYRFRFAFSYSYNMLGEMIEADYFDPGTDDYASFAVKGGVSKIFDAWLYSNNLSVADYFVQNKKFLTWMPDNLKVHPRQPVRLWYLNDSSESFRINATVYFTDGTSVVRSFGQYRSGRLLECSVGSSELRLASVDVSKVVRKYEVWLQNSTGTVLSEKRAFVLDHTLYRRNDVFFFRNSLGVYETFWAHGDRSDSMSNEKTETVLPLAGPSARRATVISSRGTFKNIFNGNTGFFRKETHSWVIDFLNSDSLFFPSGYVLHPVIIEPGDFRLTDDRSDLFSVDYKFRVAHNEDYYSAEPPVESPFGDFNDDFNKDFFVS